MLFGPNGVLLQYLQWPLEKKHHHGVAILLSSYKTTIGGDPGPTIAIRYLFRELIFEIRRLISAGRRPRQMARAGCGLGGVGGCNEAALI